MYGSKLLGFINDVPNSDKSTSSIGAGALLINDSNGMGPVFRKKEEQKGLWTIGSKELANDTPYPLVEPISDFELTDKDALSQKQITKIISKHNPKLLDNKYQVDKLIYNAAQKYGINPKALLATLQQEQSWALNGRISKMVGAGTEGKPWDLPVDKCFSVAAATYRKWFDFGTKALQSTGPVILKLNDNDFSYRPRTAAEYSRFQYTPWTYFTPHKSRPYDQWVSYFRSF